VSGDEEGDEEEGEEAKVAKPMRDPGQPTMAEREAHEATHLPFRIWCDACVKGRRDNPPHRKMPEEEHTKAEVAMDYCFFRRQEETENITTLLTKDRHSRAIRAATLRSKGICLEESVDKAIEMIRGYGHRGGILVKADNEPALKALREAVMERLTDGAIPVDPPARESESSGSVENGVKLFKGMLRVLLVALERKIEGHIPSSHPLMAWLTEHVSDVVTKYLRGNDGKTAYERLFGKQVHEEGLEFGEKVMWRKRRTQDSNVLIEPRWSTGIWLGRTWGSISHRVAISSREVIEVRAVQRVPKVERWNRLELEALVASPWCWRVPAEEVVPPAVIPPVPQAAAQEEPQEPGDEYQPKRVYIQKPDLDRWGYTQGCRRCTLMRQNRRGQGVKHKEACRKRIEEHLRQEGDGRLTAAENRINVELGRRIQDAEEENGQHEEGDAQDPAPEEEPIEPQPIEVEEDDQRDMVNLLARGMPAVVAKDFVNMYELFMIYGVAPAEAKAKVCELFSPPRVTAEMTRLPIVGLIAGTTFDLREDVDGRSWNFLLESDRRRARRIIQTERPFLVIGSPPCTAFSIMNAINFARMPADEVRRRMTEARILFDFAMEVYEMQLRAGRHFLHEHPQSASSWKEPRVQRLLNDPRVSTTVGHLCQYGMKTRGDDGEWKPARKATRFMSTSSAVLRRLGRKCDKLHVHQHLTGGRASAAAIYPPELCRAILRGIEDQRRLEGKAIPEHVEKLVDSGCAIYNLQEDTVKIEIDPEMEYEELEHEDAGMSQWGQQGVEYATGEHFYDNISGEPLPPELVRKARQEEIDFMMDWQVWEEVPIDWCKKMTGKGPLGGRWVDVNKGDSKAPMVRCRYVAKEIAFKKSDDFFAAMPPLEALRALISSVATGRKPGHPNRKMLIIDARKAHLHATPEREIFVDLPPEIRKPGYCGRLKRCLYGTRDAPARWEAFLAKELKRHGFVQGQASPCCFKHCQRDIQCVVHGDDFVFGGVDHDLSWVQARMQESFLIKVVGKLGDGPKDDREVRVLNRVVRWTSEGIIYEADPRHAELLVRDLEAKGVSVKTPGAKEEKSEEADEPLGGEETSMFRSGAARANYLAMDRPDLAFATKELCRRMASPGRRDMAALQRIARYLAVEGRLVYEYKWQSESNLRVYVDTDFAGCMRTRKSTSGGCALLGAHLVKHWSSTQRVVTLSSGEAELAGIVKGAAEALGLQSLLRDLGRDVGIQIFADSSAAIGICRRSGIGKVRHLAVGQLWVQERLRLREFELFKVAGTRNLADTLTKHVPREVADRHLEEMAIRRMEGRPTSAPQIVSS